MKNIAFDLNDSQMSFNYIRSREGPNQFVCYYKHQAVLRQDPKDAWRILGVAKFTDNGKKLKEWCISTHEEATKPKPPKDDEPRPCEDSKV